MIIWSAGFILVYGVESLELSLVNNMNNHEALKQNSAHSVGDVCSSQAGFPCSGSTVTCSELVCILSAS